MDAIDGVVNLLLDDVDFPLTNWYFYVEAMLGSYITNYNTSLFSAEREGFANSVIVAVSVTILEYITTVALFKIIFANNNIAITLTIFSFAVL